MANTTRIVDEGGTHHATWLAAVKERDAGLPLITVANHISVFDDPGMMGNIVPWYHPSPSPLLLPTASPRHAGMSSSTPSG